MNWVVAATVNQKAVLAATDGMYGSTYVSGCDYLTKIAYNGVKSGGSCYDLSDGFVYLYTAHGHHYHHVSFLCGCIGVGGDFGR